LKFERALLSFVTGRSLSLPEEVFIGLDKHKVEQTGAVIGPSSLRVITMPSGVTAYTVTNGKIDEGKFIKLDRKVQCMKSSRLIF
jgi:hypothetical protein